MHLRKLTLSVLALVVAASSTSAELLLRYKFDEASSGNQDAQDFGKAPAAPGVFQDTGVMGATRTGNTPNGASLGALDLTGAAAGDLRYVTGGDADKLDGLAAFTLTAWINVQATPTGNRRLLAKQAPATFEGFSWNVNDPAVDVRSATNFGLRLFVGGENGFLHDLSGDRISLDASNKWIFVAVTYDGAVFENNVHYYSGGTNSAVQHLVATTIPAGATLGSDARFTVGHTDAAATANTALQGWLDDVRVYNTALTEAELDAVRRENLGAAPEPPRAVRLVSAAYAGNAFTFQFESQSGRNHLVQYKNALGDATWTSLASLPGTGSLLAVTNSNPAVASRFYRVITE